MHKELTVIKLTELHEYIIVLQGFSFSTETLEKRAIHNDRQAISYLVICEMETEYLPMLINNNMLLKLFET